ncbi:MAG: copper-translocating P-type ATPase, partial [Thermodesulfovibrionales bacterium]|nr:copper-translocating P-type ATPase [Thermodesulfovibrionales bacterium]
PVVFYSGMPILRSALSGLKGLRFNMDSLIAMGAGSAFFYSVYGLLTGGKVFFDTAAMLITLILLGRYIESSLKGRAAETIDLLAELVPREATIVVDGKEGRKRVPVESLKPGVLVEVRPGEKFPVDGVVESGETEADEALLTGEPMPVYKGLGAEVVGGSQNLYGSVLVRASLTGRDTLLSGIIRAVEDAQASKPRIQGLADRVVGVFVPVILVLAAVTTSYYLASGTPFPVAMMTGISVLVIACPCSLGLATPLAVLVYTLMASSKGILIKSGQSAELASGIKHVVFDKTGTLTTGKPSLEFFLTLPGSFTELEVLRLAASVETLSEHPLGMAIVRAAKESFTKESSGGFSPYEVSGFRALPGKGVMARAEGRHIVVGNSALMYKNGLALDESFDNRTSEAASGGETVIYMGWAGKVKAMFMVSDTLRPEARDAVERLKSLGCRVSVISGDSPATVEGVSARAGAGDAIGGVLPDEKRQKVAVLQSREAVLMVGDGINDAPALTEAAVGVAMGRGTDIAMESAGVVLLRDDLCLIPYFISLSRRSFRIIRQNIFWAFFYNIVALPLAVAGILHPIVAAGAMAASSLVVVGNSLRIRNILRGA